MASILVRVFGAIQEWARGIYIQTWLKAKWLYLPVLELQFFAERCKYRAMGK